MHLYARNYSGADLGAVPVLGGVAGGRLFFRATSEGTECLEYTTEN